MKDEKVNANADEFFETQELTSDNMDGVAGGAGAGDYSSAGEWDGCCPLCGEKMTLYSTSTSKRQYIIFSYYRCEACGHKKKTIHYDSQAEIH